MKVLFVSGPGIGHAFPLVPLAWAFRAAGHEIRFATAGPALAVRDAGLPVVDLRPGWDHRAAIAARRTPRGPAERGRGVDVFGAAVREVAQRWRPELVVGRSLGAIAADELGVPLVDHGVGLLRLVEEPANGVALDVAPPSLLAGPPVGWSMRYVPYNGGTVLTDLPPADRPRIAVTLGTAVPLTDGLDPLRQLVAIAGDVPAEFVLALGEADPAELPPLPDNVRIAGWWPLTALLPHCAGLVHHGGEGTLMTALALGVPQLVLPTGELRAPAGAAVRDRGVGLTGDLSPALLTELIESPTLRAAAAEVRAEIAALPAPAELVPRLAELVSG